jgi:hypothetical protein
MADLAGRWGITANTVSRRLSFLGIKPIRQGNYRFITAEQLALGDELQQHILGGKPMEAFPRTDQPEGGLVARRVEAPVQVAGQVEQVAALVAAINAAMPQPTVEPLRVARALAEAAHLGVALSSAELAEVLGMSASTVSSWGDGHQPRPGFTLQRQKVGAAVWWMVNRTDGRQPPTSPATSRAVGFLSDAPIAASFQTVRVSAISLPAF